MRVLCAAVLFLASAAPAWAASFDDQIPERAALDRAAWAFVFWSQAVTDEAALLGLPPPAIRTRYRPDAPAAGALNLLGTAGPGAVQVLLEGDGWQNRSASAERILARNAAHEAAHLYQHAKGEPFEPQWLHEGFADAMAFAAMDARGEAGAWAGGQRCAGALRRGRLRARFAGGDPDALYDCASLLIRAVAEARGESPRALYDAVVAGGRSEAAFMRLAAKAGPEWSRSARAFLSRDWTNSDPFWVIRTMRAGGL